MNIIAGMHRSGTSLVARLMAEAGADFGDPATFYPADEWNPDGYYEQKEIHAVNMPLINGPFWKFAYFKLPSARTISRRAQSRGDEIRRLSEKYSGEKWVKENRFCLTLEAWSEQGAQVDRMIVCLREPFEVARSVQRRNRVPLAHGYRLWYEHHTRLDRAAAGVPQWYVLYSDLAAPRTTYLQETIDLMRFAGLPHDRESVIGLQSLIREGAPKNDEPPPSYPTEVRSLWNELRERHHRQRSNGDVVMPQSVETLP